MSTRFWALVIALAVALAACQAKRAPSASGSAGSASAGATRGSSGGFSATLSADLAAQASGSTPETGAAGAPVGPSGSAAPGGSVPTVATGTTSGSAATAPGTSAPSGGVKPSAGSAATASGGAKPTVGGAPPPIGSSAPTTTAKPGVGSSAPTTTATSGAGSATPTTTVKSGAGSADTAKVAAGKPPATAKVAESAVVPPANRAHVKPPADVAAIKLDLEPNWERDVGEAGTFSLVVKLPSSNDTRLFSVRYGYEDPTAPFDCDQYRKFLEDKNLMKVTLNRQRGAACYLEGTDVGGGPAFRFLISYGGKRLSCHGSLYRDAASNALGDLRDKVLQQGKKICESLAL